MAAVAVRQVGRQGDDAAVLDDHGGEAPQQAEPAGPGRLDVPQGGGEQLPEEGVGGRPHAAVQGLGREVEADGEGLQGGAGLVDPAEDQGLGEVGGAEVALALDQAGAAAQQPGGGGEEGVQGGGQSCYSSHRELLS